MLKESTSFKSWSSSVTPPKMTTSELLLCVIAECPKRPSGRTLVLAACAVCGSSIVHATVRVSKSHSSLK